MATLHYSLGENENGTYYINKYFKDDYGTTRRQTIYDNLTLELTHDLLDTLEAAKEFEHN